ncbi:MAG: response regulator receiver protein [Polaromonas sp.]|jgi:CheY-like chemotaxis protein|nr:response regulator receiver protein [Polaromonas sp.]
MDYAAHPTAPVTLFYSYAHEDEVLREELQGHLKLLERRGLLAPWHDRQIVPGANWANAIDANLRSAELVLLLVSKDFIESDYIWGTELSVAMQRQDKNEAVVVPIVVRAIDFDPKDPQELPFLKLQALPTDLRPVTSWPNRDEAWTNVAKGLRATVKSIRERRPPLPNPPLCSAPLDPDTDIVVTHTDGEIPTILDYAFRGLDKLILHSKQGLESVRLKAGQELTPHVDHPATDPLLERVIGDVSQQIVQAHHHRSAAPMDETATDLVQQQTRALIDLPEQQRVLWVDDRPEGNRFEAAALAKLQIEVVTARSTDEALRIIEADQEGFTLVISDWERVGEEKQAGLRLLARLRQAGVQWPLIYYHRAVDETRAQRAAQARAAGALGEAVLPAELMKLVVQALNANPAQP